MITLSSLDYGLITFYFLIVFGLAFMVTGKKLSQDSEEYFLAGRNLGWFVVGASIFASNIGSEHLIGLAGSGATTGVIVAQFELIACFVLLLLGWVFAPFYIKSGVVTMPEFLERRYSKAARDYLTYVSIIAYVLTKISVTIYAGSVLFESIGVSFWDGALIVVIATGAYTIFGGLKAVIYTDMIQMIVMIIGATLVVYFGLDELGGLGELKTTLSPSFFSMWRTMDDPSFPWTGVLFGAPILGVWYWCTDQFVVQRVLSAKNIKEARKGTIFAGFLKVLPLYLFVFPGMICFALAQKGVLVLDRSDQALPVLASYVLPNGLRGLFVAGLLAALMSSLSSVFNSCSTLVTYEIFKRKNPNLSERRLVQIGRLSTVGLVILGIAWIPMMKHISGELFTYIQSVQAYISPPIAAVFFLGLFIKRINAKAAVTALYAGLIIGVFRLVLEIQKDSIDGIVLEFASINFLHFAALLFLFVSILMIVISFVTPKDDKDLSNVTYNGDMLKLMKGTKTEYILSILLVFTVLFIWWFYQ